MHGASTGRVHRGDLVRRLHDPDAGEGIVRHVGIDRMIFYMGHNEWLTEFTRFAIVEFPRGRESVPTAELIRSDQVASYESLRPGDLIVYGRRKHATAIVLRILPRQAGRPCVTDRRVIIIEDGVKRSLSLASEILDVRRVE